MNLKIKLIFNTLSNIFKLDKFIFIPVLILCIINIFVQYSATDKNISKLLNDSLYIFISLVIMIFIANLNQNRIKSIAMPIYVLSIILLVGVIFFGVSVNGAKRWLNLGIRIQPSELSKLSIPLVLAYFFSTKQYPHKLLHFIVGFILLLIPFLLIAKQPDLGTGILVLSAGIYVLFLAELPWKLIIFAFIIFILSTPLIWHFLQPYQQHRILTLIDPQSDPLGKGYHIIQGMIAIGSGGFWGKGYLQGTQTHLNFIPEKHTDFVLTVIAEEFGLIGVTTILILYLIIVLRGLRIMKNTTDSFSKLLCGSITLSFMTYVFINTGMVAGIFPVVGIPLPLISYGGTATIVIMAGLGILLSATKNKH